MADEAVHSFRDVKFPQTQVRSFFGACNVYRRFLKDFSKIARPLTDMTRNPTNLYWDRPTEEQLVVFEALKARMISPPVLSLSHLGKS